MADARAARDRAAAHEQATRANLRRAGIQAKLAIDKMDDNLTAIASKYLLTPSTLSKLNPGKVETKWEPLGLDSYKAIDEITGEKYLLAELRTAFDDARRRAKEAEAAVSLAEARTEKADATDTILAGTPAQDGRLIIDDVLVDPRPDQVVLDIRVRNAGQRTVDITRVAVRIVTREEFLTAYEPTAHYDLVVDGDYNEVKVAHVLKPDEVDRFTLALGFAAHELGCVFTAELELRFNSDHVVVSKPFRFSSCFE